MKKWPFSAWDNSFLFRICKTKFSCEYNKVYIERNIKIDLEYHKILHEYYNKSYDTIRKSIIKFSELLSSYLVKLCEFTL